jgi:heme A synthase
VADWEQLAGRLRVAAWLALAGLCLQLAGIGWDTLQHHNDPDLALRESVFSLTNPSHLLMAAGMSLTAVGVGYGLVCLASPRTGPRPSTAAAIAAVVLATLWLGVVSVALRTGGVSGRHDHDRHGAARELPAPGEGR